VFGVRMRVVRMRLGDEAIELAADIPPRGRPFRTAFVSPSAVTFADRPLGFQEIVLAE
jgi:hypothetical protein